ncbi:hypothetical protein CEUSTIGMA_g11258.t1 [Chlamydomonas eustigma]|uniref:tRNA-splicing endonuclease subunit Sen15 domain-containing protein n=1 Tax=Chlamydomonas eustigma TaxID=1157962 RepID=A0A250XL83_9CHLO|nr:hypothetical protein CEUSTIGMA_g11258.t1 [Chlamydomonas eustigma]|eukprot:GAX83834.1 hypothetical protein CEUSTIGMA_g11258.t1 [Chlamydomonas eustigma]
MNRRWQKDGRGRYESLESYNSVVGTLPELSHNLGLCDQADYYATYSALHSKGKNIQTATNVEAGFHYFLIEINEESGSSPAFHKHETAHLEAELTSSSAQIEGMRLQCSTGNTSEATESQSPVLPRPAFTSTSGRRLEPVVPVSSKHTGLSLPLIQRLFNLGEGLVARHLLLAIADDDGSVSLLRVFNYAQPPFEGPEALPSVDAGLGVDSEED